MEEFVGTIKQEYQNKDSKSEGLVPYLVVGDTDDTRITYRLYRAGVYGINDDFFAAYDNKIVTVQGEVEMEIWIKVDNIQVLDTEDDISK